MARFLPGKKGQIKHPTAPLSYHYQPGIKIMDDSVLTLAFDMPTTLPTILARGPGRTAGMLGVFPGYTQPWATLAIPVNSFGGSQAGKFVLSPLVDTNGDTSGE